MQEIVTAGDLFSYIESKNGKLLEVEAAVIVRQILVALSFLHGKNIVHRDIKPDNVLMTSLAAGCRIVLTDFGAARRIENRLHRMSSVIGTHEYAAPYVLPLLLTHRLLILQQRGSGLPEGKCRTGEIRLYTSCGYVGRWMCHSGPPDRRTGFL
jgi:serine/threonine protein kinase